MESPRPSPVETARSSIPFKSDRKRKRATRACLGCRARKVRCDVVRSEDACTNCRLDSLECVLQPRKQSRPMWNDGLRSYRRRRLSNVNSNTNTEEALSEHGAQGDSSPPAEADGRDAEEEAQQVFPSQQSCDSRDQGDKRSVDPSSQANNTRPDVAVSVLDYGIHATPPENCYTQRECQAIDLRTPFKQRSQMNTPSGPTYEIPAFIKPLPDWLTSKDLDYLRSKGALTIPSNPLRGQLLQRFFEYVYPFMPLLDMKELLQAIELEGEDSAPRVSILLFQAIMFAGTAFVDMAHLRAAGYSVRRAARREFFDRVKLLYGLNIERFDITLIQSLLLMTHWYHDHTSHKDLWDWMGIVTTMSQAGALHIGVEHHGLSLREQRLRKRLGWCVFMRDQVLALGMRRPARIQLDSHQIPILSLDDFECNSIKTTVLPSGCTVARDLAQQRHMAVLCIEVFKLSVCMSLVLSTQYRPASRMLSRDDGPTLILVARHEMLEEKQFDGCNQYLEGWKRSLPIMCMYDSISALSACESPVIVIHKALLKMMYHTVVAALYRPQIMPFSPWSPTTSSIVEAAKSLTETSQTKIHSAASEISGIGHDLQKLGLLHYLPTSSVTAFLPALIIHLMHIAYAREEQVAQSMQHFSSGMAILTTLSDNYASAELAVHFLESTINLSNMRISRVARLLHRSPPSEPNSWLQSTHLPNIYHSPPGENRRSRSGSLVDSTSGKKEHCSNAMPIPNGYPWPEWSLWLDGEPLESNFVDPSLAESLGPRLQIHEHLHAESLDSPQYRTK
ncbi:C6 transcription factor [Penicillium lividum]|nr:C6 transcription factor [Penicillium lividum]